MAARGTKKAHISRAEKVPRAVVDLWTSRTSPQRLVGSGGRTKIGTFKEDAIKRTLTQTAGTMTVTEVARHHRVSRHVIYRIAGAMRWKT